MKLQAIGALFILACVVLDTIIRVRMKSNGAKWIFLRGGTFDYKEYMKVRTNYGWSAWPVYAIAVTFILGIVFLIVGFIVRYGASTNQS